MSNYLLGPSPHSMCFNTCMALPTNTAHQGHRFQAVKAMPFLRAGLPIPTTCAYCGQPAGHPVHNTRKGAR